MKKLILLFGILLIGIYSAYAATNWVCDPADMNQQDGTNFPGQNCAPEEICGDSSGTAQCYEADDLTAPSGNTSSTTNQDDGTCDGGYIIQQYITADGSAPFCDNSGNYWCDRNSDVFSTQLRQTVCVGSGQGGDFGIYANGSCRSGQYNCYGTGTSPCESTSTSDCENSNNNHYNTGTCETDYGTTPSATCVCDTNYFACDGSIVDTDGCEIHAGDSCGSSTGYIILNECASGSAGNCTASGARANNRDCDDSDSDGDQLTCNSGNGCEITLFSDTNNTQSVYQSCTTFACASGYLDCNPGGDPAGDGTNPDGCETQEGGTCGNSTGTFATNQCAGTSGNCTRTTDLLDCDDDDSDGDQLTCNGANGCEVNPGSACTTGGLPGTVANQCPFTCEVDDVDIATSGDETIWSGINPFLWLNQLGSGAVAYFNASNNITVINSSGVYFNGFDLATDTVGGSGGGSGNNFNPPWLYNASGQGYFNETHYNITTNQTIFDTVVQSFIELLSFNITSDLKNYFDSLYQPLGSYIQNRTDINITTGYFDSVLVPNASLCPSGYAMTGFPNRNISETQCVEIDSIVTDNWLNESYEEGNFNLSGNFTAFGNIVIDQNATNSLEIYGFLGLQNFLVNVYGGVYSNDVSSFGCGFIDGDYQFKSCNNGVAGRNVFGLKGVSGQQGDYIKITNSSDENVTRIDAQGNIIVKSIMFSQPSMNISSLANNEIDIKATNSVNMQTSLFNVTTPNGSVYIKAFNATHLMLSSTGTSGGIIFPG